MMKTQSISIPVSTPGSAKTLTVSPRFASLPRLNSDPVSPVSFSATAPEKSDMSAWVVHDVQKDAQGHVTGYSVARLKSGLKGRGGIYASDLADPALQATVIAAMAGAAVTALTSSNHVMDRRQLFKNAAVGGSVLGGLWPKSAFAISSLPRAEIGQMMNRLGYYSVKQHDNVGNATASGVLIRGGGLHAGKMLVLTTKHSYDGEGDKARGWIEFYRARQHGAPATRMDTRLVRKAPTYNPDYADVAVIEPTSVLRPDDPRIEPGLPSYGLARMSDVKVGDIVVSAGKPVTDAITVRMGTVTDTHPRLPRNNAYSNPGDSGAPAWILTGSSGTLSVALLGINRGGPNVDFTYIDPKTGQSRTERHSSESNAQMVSCDVIRKEFGDILQATA